MTSDEFWERLVRTAATWEPDLRRAFLSRIRWQKDHVDLPALLEALATHQYDTATALLLGSRPTWPELTTAVQGVLFKAAHTVAAEAGIVATVLQAANPRALAVLAQQSADLVREVTASTRAGIRQYLLQQVAQGRNPRALIPQLVGYLDPTTGLRTGGIVGLTARQAQAVANYRSYLEANDATALRRALRDRRSDSAVQTAIATKQPLAPAQIDRLVARYESRYLAFRAETIARTESLRALQLGQRLAWDEAIASGVWDPARLIKRWVTARDERVRPLHRQMDQQVVPYMEDFVLPDQTTTWGPPHAFNCRCVNWIRPRL